MDDQSGKNNEQSSNVNVRAGGASDRGPTRSENQDAYWIPADKNESKIDTIYLVADGVGGQESGADAAQLAVQTARQDYSTERNNQQLVPDALRSALQNANTAVYEESQRREVRRMGATFVAAVIHQGRLLIAHVGDARAYLIRDGEMLRLTRDDTWVQKQVEEGWITEEQAANHEYRNVVTQVLGNKPEVNVHLSREHDLRDGDAVLLCSDGLYGALTNEQMLPIIDRYDPDEAARRLIEAAIEADASDNITAVLVKVSIAGNQVIGPAAAATIADGAMLALPLAEEPTMPIAMADEPTIPPLPPPAAPLPAATKSKAPNWLVILAVTAVILIAATLLFFWVRNRNLSSDVTTAAQENMTAVAVDAAAPTEPSGALKPAPVKASEDPAPTTAPTSEPPTETPLPTPTLLATSTLEATPLPRGCINDRFLVFVWDREQLETGSCGSNADIGLETGDEVLILDNNAVTGVGNCTAVSFIRIQLATDSNVEGWVFKNAVDPLAPGGSCSP